MKEFVLDLVLLFELRDWQVAMLLQLLNKIVLHWQHMPLMLLQILVGDLFRREMHRPAVIFLLEEERLLRAYVYARRMNQLLNTEILDVDKVVDLPA